MVGPEGQATAQDWLHRMNIEMALQVNTWLTEHGENVDL